MQLLGVRQAAAIPPEALVEADRVHHERVAFPPADGMTVIAGRQVLRVRATVHVDGAERVRPADIEDIDALQLGGLDELRAVRREELTGHSRRLAARVRLELVLLTLGEQRLRPWLERHLVPGKRRVPDPEICRPEERLLHVAAAEDHAARRVPGRRSRWCCRTTTAAAATATGTAAALTAILCRRHTADDTLRALSSATGRTLGSGLRLGLTLTRLSGLTALAEQRFHEHRGQEERAGDEQRETIAHERVLLRNGRPGAPYDDRRPTRRKAGMAAAPREPPRSCVPMNLRVAASARRGVQRFARPSTGGRQRHAARVHALGAVFRQPPLDGDQLAVLQRFTPPALALQAVRGTHLGAPVLDLAGLLVLHVDVEPHMRIGPLDLGDGAAQLDRLVRVELRRE